MVTLAHLSDVHLSPLPPVGLQDLLNKRITGFLNWQMKRAKHMQSDTLTNLVQHMAQQNPDITAVTGDLVNLALDAEFEHAAEWIKTLGPPDKVCTIPGNHDVYVKGADTHFLRALGAYGTGECIDEEPFPYVRCTGDVAVIGCSSAIATPPFFAAGRFDIAQAERLQKTLADLGKENLFRVVLIHHPPHKEIAARPRRGLWQAHNFRNAIAGAGAELVLHGHTHRSSINGIVGPDGEVPVIGVAAGSADARSGDDPARYNLFDIEKTHKGWSCNMREYGFQRIGEGIVLRIQTRIY